VKVGHLKCTGAWPTVVGSDNDLLFPYEYWFQIRKLLQRQ